MNLLENAVKYTHHGEVVVTVQSLHTESDKNELSFEIKDSGIGIPADQVRHLFYGAAGKEFISRNRKAGYGSYNLQKACGTDGGKD